MDKKELAIVIAPGVAGLVVGLAGIVAGIAGLVTGYEPLFDYMNYAVLVMWAAWLVSVFLLLLATLRFIWRYYL